MKAHKKKKLSYNQEKHILKWKKQRLKQQKEIVSRVYPKEDVEKAKYLSDKFQNIDIYRKDSCFNFSFTAEAEERSYNSHTNQNETIKVVKPQDKHFELWIERVNNRKSLR
jgi:hypothetical protein